MAHKYLKALLASTTLFFITTCAFAQIDRAPPHNQGFSTKQHEMMGIYNAPGRIDIKGDWDIYFTGEFLWWQAKEDGLEYALSQPNGQAIRPNIGGNFIRTDFDYKPGYRLAFGWNTNFDNWTLEAEYTNLHILLSDHTFAPTAGVLFPFWFNFDNNRPNIVAATNSAASKADARWRLRVDILDFAFARSCYVGTKFILKPHTGLRAAWIRQGYGADYLMFTDFTTGASFPAISRSKSTSWALGPRVGMDTAWMLSKDFRLFGNIATSILFTDYTVRLRQTDLANLDPLNPLINVTNKINQIRPNMECAVGFGWGTFLDRLNGHLDLSASYEFHLFWDQNMMRSLKDTIVSNVIEDNGSLYLQGLTISARFDF